MPYLYLLKENKMLIISAIAKSKYGISFIEIIMSEYLSLYNSSHLNRVILLFK